MPEFETLYALAEISVAMAGFAAIVVVFKRRSEGSWDRADADQFNGMLLHAIAAGFFCILPPAISIFTPDPSVVWTVGSAALGLQILGHAGIIFWLPTTSLVARVSLVLPLGAVALQVLNVSGVYFSAEFRPYLGGVLWHLFQAGLLFVRLVWVTAEDPPEPG